MKQSGRYGVIDLTIYKDKKVFITGHYGFKGTWLFTWLKKLGAGVQGYSIPNYNAKVFKKLYKNEKENYQYITDYSELYMCMKNFNPDIIFHLAAQPLVLEGYANPHNTFYTNIKGTLNILEISKSCSNLKGFINITTDKVYENREQEIGYTEESQLGGYDPYAVSKVCSELITKCYSDCFLSNNVVVATCRAGNVIGGGDFSPDRIITDIMNCHFNNKKLIIRHPNAVRPFTYILDIIYGYLSLGVKILEERCFFQGAWNFSTKEKTSVSYIVNKLGINYEIEESDKHETTVLMLDSSKSKEFLEWEPLFNIDMILSETFKWYKEYYNNEKIITGEQIDEYEEIRKS